MASEYTPNRRYPLYTDSDKPNLRDQYNGAIREIDTDMADALHNSQAVSDALGSGFDAQHTVRMAIDGCATDAELSSEVSARQAADTLEATARQNADTALGTRIDNEVTARQNADTSLGNRISTIEGIIPSSSYSSSSTVKQAIDSKASNTALTNETTARQNADTALGNRVSALEGMIPSSAFSSSSTIKSAIDGKANASSLSSETTARQNADTALGNRITALETAKKVIVFGDSWATSDNNTWPAAFAAQHGLTLVDHAVGGAGWSQAGQDGKNILQQVQNAASDSNAKYVIVIGGVNDARNNIAYSTVKANMVSVIAALKTKYPTAATMICPINVPKRGYVNGSVDVCRMIFDNYYYNIFDDAALEGCATFDLLPALQPLAHVNSYNTDGLHPSGYGNKFILSTINECVFGKSGILINRRNISAKSGFTKYGQGLAIIDGICYPQALGFDNHAYTAGTAVVIGSIDNAGSGGVTLPFYQPKSIGDKYTIAQNNSGNLCGIVALSTASGEITFRPSITGTYQVFFNLPTFTVAG